MATAPIRRVNPAAAAARGVASRPAAPQPKPAPIRRTEVVGKAVVTSAAKRAREDEPYHEQQREDEVLVRVFEENQHPAIVTVSAGLTISPAPFESVRIDVRVSIPCLPSEIDQAYLVASDFVAEKVSEEEVAWVGATRAPAPRGR